MGIDLLTCALVIDQSRRPDWAAAEIAALRADAFSEPSLPDRLSAFGFAPVLECDPEDAADRRAVNESLRAQLRADLAEARSAICDHHRLVNRLEIRGASVYLTGGPSGGDSPSELFDVFGRLLESGVAAAAGFE